MSLRIPWFLGGGLPLSQNVAAWIVAGLGVIAYHRLSGPPKAVVLAQGDLDAINSQRKAALAATISPAVGELPRGKEPDMK